MSIDLAVLFLHVTRYTAIMKTEFPCYVLGMLQILLYVCNGNHLKVRHICEVNARVVIAAAESLYMLNPDIFLSNKINIIGLVFLIGFHIHMCMYITFFFFFCRISI